MIICGQFVAIHVKKKSATCYSLAPCSSINQSNLVLSVSFSLSPPSGGVRGGASFPLPSGGSGWVSVSLREGQGGCQVSILLPLTPHFLPLFNFPQYHIRAFFRQVKAGSRLCYHLPHQSVDAFVWSLASQGLHAAHDLRIHHPLHGQHL